MPSSRPRRKDAAVRLCLVAAFVALVCALCLAPAAPTASAFAVPSITINVPRKAGVISQTEIAMLKVTVSVTSTAAASFTITPPSGPAFAVTVSPGDASQLNQPLGVGGDVVDVHPPSGALSNTDPLKRKYVFLIKLISNLDAGCGSAMPAPETFTIAVAGPQQIDRACAQSLDPNVGSCMPGSPGGMRTVPLTEPVATITTPGSTASLQGCRPGVDCVLVLDRSGSMDSPVLGGPSPSLPKMTALKTAVSTFMTAWRALRENEVPAGVPALAPITDRVGVAFFDSSNPALWLSQIVPMSGTADGMNTMNNAATTNSVTGNISTHTMSVTTANATSIGSGLRLGDAALTPLLGNGNRKVFVVMSDGMENTDPQTRVNPGDPTDVQTTVGGVGTSLVSQPPAQIYALTIGSTNAIDPTINQAISTASNGFYLNSEYDQTLLTNFFLEVLQNFVKYSTVETYRMASAVTSFGTIYETKMPVTSTTTSLTFTVSWNRSRGPLRLTVTPPAGGGSPITRVEQADDAPGSMVLNVPLPLKGQLNSGGEWTIRVAPEPVIGSLFSRLPQTGDVPFNLIVLGDDTAVNSELGTVAADYAPGDQVRLSARLTELGEPVTGLGSQPGATVVAELVRPDAGGIGDLLSASTASATPSPEPDRLSPADAKLFNTLKADPNAIKRATTTVQLVDDGSAASGDAVANDGVYSALFPAQLIGHYNFLFGVTGTAKRAGNFSRMQLRTVHVRALPDGAQTQTSASVQDNAVVVQMTPMTKFGNRLGPGWGNYFWVTASGHTPVKFKDNLDGTYTANMPFTGDPPSDVKVHFERVNERIPDDVTPDRLPVPLGDGNAFEPNVPVEGGGGGGGQFRRWGFSLHAGAGFPHGNFGNAYDPGPNVGVDLEYRFNKYFSLEAIYTFHRFNSALAFLDDLNTHQFSLNGKVYGGTSPVRPFFNFGGGAYKFDPGDTRGGVNAGGGLQFDVKPNFAFDAMYNYHTVFFPLSDAKFSTVQGGLRWRF